MIPIEIDLPQVATGMGATGIALLSYLVRNVMTAQEVLVKANKDNLTMHVEQQDKLYDRLHKTMSEILAEAKITNHRITALEAREQVRLEGNGNWKDRSRA